MKPKDQYCNYTFLQTIPKFKVVGLAMLNLFMLKRVRHHSRHIAVVLGFYQFGGLIVLICNLAIVDLCELDRFSRLMLLI